MTDELHPLRINIGFLLHKDNSFVHVFDFEFAKLHIAPDIDLVDVIGAAKFTRTQQGLLCEMTFAGHQLAECSRCLDETDVVLKTEFVELYAFDNRSITDSGLVVPENGMIELSPLLREYLLLEVPLNSLCRPDCLGLCPTCGKNLNNSPHTHKEEKIDPRFAALKDLLEEDDK